MSLDPDTMTELFGTSDIEKIKGKISNQHVDNIMIQEIILFMNTKNSLNLNISRVSQGFDGLGPELEKPENGGYNRWVTENKNKGMYEPSKRMTSNIQLLSEYIGNSSVDDMESLISKLVIDLVNARAVIDLGRLKKKEHKDQFLPEVRQFITEMVGPFHYRYESNKKNSV